MNITLLSGRLTSDVTTRTAGDKEVANFTLAVDRYKDQTDFIPCVAWEKKAAVLRDYTKKGDKILIQGELRQRQYEDQNGKKITTWEVYVLNVELPPKSKETKAEPKQEQGSFDDFAPF